MDTTPPTADPAARATPRPSPEPGSAGSASRAPDHRRLRLRLLPPEKRATGVLTRPAWRRAGASIRRLLRPRDPPEHREEDPPGADVGPGGAHRGGPARGEPERGRSVFRAEEATARVVRDRVTRGPATLHAAGGAPSDFLDARDAALRGAIDGSGAGVAPSSVDAGGAGVGAPAERGQDTITADARSRAAAGGGVERGRRRAHEQEAGEEARASDERGDRDATDPQGARPGHRAALRPRDLDRHAGRDVGSRVGSRRLWQDARRSRRRGPGGGGGGRVRTGCGRSFGSGKGPVLFAGSLFSSADCAMRSNLAGEPTPRLCEGLAALARLAGTHRHDDATSAPGAARSRTRPRRGTAVSALGTRLAGAVLVGALSGPHHEARRFARSRRRTSGQP